MRIHTIAGVTISIVAGVNCSSELAERPAANDPTNAASDEAPFRRPPAYKPDPLLSVVPPKSQEPPPTGKEQIHSPTASPPGNPPMREEPGGHRPVPTVYTCPMHPEVGQTRPGQCAKCGMALVPIAPKDGTR